MEGTKKKKKILYLAHHAYYVHACSVYQASCEIEVSEEELKHVAIVIGTKQLKTPFADQDLVTSQLPVIIGKKPKPILAPISKEATGVEQKP